MVNEVWQECIRLAEMAMDESNYELAAREYLSAASMGCIDANIALAVLYMTGAGVECDGIRAKDLLEAVVGDEGSSRKQRSLALNNLASLYSVGLRNLARDAKKAEYFQKMARLSGFPD